MMRFCCSLLLLLVVSPASAQDTPLPQSTTVFPPDVPPRPPLIAIPKEITEASEPTFAQSPHKPPLSWRARAHKLKLARNAQQITLESNYDAAIMSLIGSLSQSGLRIDTLNSKAGEVLALPADNRTNHKFIFVLSEMPPGTVTIKGAAWTQSKASSTVIDSVFQAVQQQTTLRRGAQIGSP